MSLPYPDDVIAWIVIYHDKDTAWGEAPSVLREAYNNIKQVSLWIGASRFIIVSKYGIRHYPKF